jgi:hypothetical protein
MEEEDTIIIQVIFKFDDGRLYNFDVDRTTTLYEAKKILSNAAHILKNSFTLYHEGQEYSKKYDEQSLQILFPTLKKIEFYLKLRKTLEDSDENEYDQISVKYNIKQPCKEHMGKFLVLYCISCKKSICNECFSLFHNNHEVEEKADYLMPAKVLMERIFSDSFMFKTDSKLSNYMSCVSFRSIIKTEIFERTRQLLNELENNCMNCLEYFSFTEDSTEKNNDLNLELLKKYCTASFIKLKNNIDTKEILINDEVFLSLYNKLKAIKDYKTRIFTENLNKFKAINQYFLPFTQEIQNMSLELNNVLLKHIKKDIYVKFKEDLSKNVVDVVQKEDVVRFMFENINVPKSGSTLIGSEENVVKNSLTPNYTQRLLPSLLHDSKNKKSIIINNSRTNILGNLNNNSNVTNNSININNNRTSINSNINSITSSISNYSHINSRANNVGSITNNITSNINNNSNIHTTSINPMNNSINYQYVQQKYTISTPINYSNNNNSLNTTNLNLLNTPNMKMNMNNTNANINMNNTNVNNNINNNNNIINGYNTNRFIYIQNVSDYNLKSVIAKEDKKKEKKEKSEKMELDDPGDTPPTQNSPTPKNTEINYSQVKLEEVKTNIIEKNSYTSPNIKKSLISVHLSPNQIDDKSDNKSAIIPNNTIQQKTLFLHKESNEDVNREEANSSKVKNSINNVSIFNGKLIDVLNKEKNVNENGAEILKDKKETISSKECVSKVSNESSKTSSFNICEKCTSKILEKTQISSNLNTLKLAEKKFPIAFMYPVYKTNIIKAAVDKNTVQEIKINFSDFSKEDPIINEFPNGGAYCNYENTLYFTGGQEYIKEAGKLFLSISDTSLSQTAIKLPLMNNYHWNHSMIAHKGKIYVIGGYNSNKCEYYDIENKSWNELPNLIEKERQRSMLFIENNYLYCFMGLSQAGILDTVERLNLDNTEAGWESIIVVNSNHINLKFYGSGIIRTNQSNKIYFIGGKKENKKKETVFKRTIYEFSFDNYEIAVSDFKIENDLFFVENKLYNMDENDCGNFINLGNGYLISMPILIK